MAEKTPLAQDENVSVPGIDIVEYDNNYQCLININISLILVFK